MSKKAFKPSGFEYGVIIGSVKMMCEIADIEKGIMQKTIVIYGVFVVMAVMPLMGQTPDKGQAGYSGKHVNVLASMRLEDAAFHIYVPPLPAQAVYASIEEAKCRTPEELVMSIQSETTQEWVHHNCLGGKGQIVTTEQFEYRKRCDKSTNYFELVHKLTFLYNGVRTAILKYWFIDDGKRTLLANMVVQEKEGRWYRTSIAGLDHLAFVVMRIKSNYLAAFLNLIPPGQETSEEREETKVLKRKIRTNTLGDQGVLDSEKLYNEIMRLRAEGKTNELFEFVDKSGG